jgi:hypothetical protein
MNPHFRELVSNPTFVPGLGYYPYYEGPSTLKFIKFLREYDSANNLKNIKFIEVLMAGLGGMPHYNNNFINVYWSKLPINSGALSILKDETNVDKINWEVLSYNYGAGSMIRKNLDRMHWKGLSMNPAAIHIIEKNPEKIDWESLSANPAAGNLLRNNHTKINFEGLLDNPNEKLRKELTN